MSSTKTRANARCLLLPPTQSQARCVERCTGSGVVRNDSAAAVGPFAKQRLGGTGTHRRASSNDRPTFVTPAKFLVSVTTPEPINTTTTKPDPPPPKSRSSPSLTARPPPYTYSYTSYTYTPSHVPCAAPYMPPRDSDSEEEREEDEGAIFTTWRGSSQAGASDGAKPASSLRARLLGGVLGASSISARGRGEPKTISTTPGTLGAGETETEADDPPSRLPTSRILPSSGPLVPPNTLQERLTPLLFEFSRLLSIVPAILGTLYNLYHIFNPPQSTLTRRAPEPIDYFVSALWSILTGHQCLCLTTGLLTRWRLYYTPLSTLIRLLALQAICWPATHFTLKVLAHEVRPVVVWAVIGSTTSVSRAVQIWVTSNLWWEQNQCDNAPPPPPDAGGGGHSGAQGGTQVLGPDGTTKGRMGSGYWKRWRGGKWGGRRWDWCEVGVKCALPAGLVYVVMAWAEALRREWSPC